MELLDNDKRMNQIEDQTTYNCRLSYTSSGGMNPINPSTRNRPEENDVGFLQRCKRELSSEVIRWKEENIRLQRLNETRQRKIEELSQKIEMLSERNAMLESSLTAAGNENDHLRMHSLAVGEENSMLLRKLSYGYNAYHSFPWSSTSNAATCFNPTKIASEETQVEAWKEVSQRLLKKMKQEMEELQEMNNCISGMQDEEEMVSAIKAPDLTVQQMEDGLSSLMGKTEFLKKHLLHQRQNLKIMICGLGQGNVHSADRSFANDSKSETANQKSNSQTVGQNSKPFSTRPSDESFRDYFTKQLQGTKGADELAAMMQLYLDSEEKKISRAAPLEPLKSSFTEDDRGKCDENSNKPADKESGSPDEDRLCPICEAVFPCVIPQKDFEAHVVDHLEAESASLLDHYVVL